MVVSSSYYRLFPWKKSGLVSWHVRGLGERGGGGGGDEKRVVVYSFIYLCF